MHGRFSFLKHSWILLAVLAGSCSIDDLLLDNPSDPNSPNFVPDPPRLSSVPAVSTDGVFLGWSGGSSFATTYRIERRMASGDFEHIATVQEKNYVDTQGVMVNVEYWYRVGALGGSGIPSYSDETTVTVVFHAPFGLSVIPNSLGGLRLYWETENTFQTTSVVERAAGLNPFSILGDVPGSTTRFMDDPVALSSGPYRYRVADRTSRNISPVSAEVTAGVLPPVPALLHTIVTGSSGADVALSATGTEAYMATSSSVLIYPVGASSGRVLNDQTNFPAITSVSLTPDGAILGSSGSSGTTLWNTGTNQFIRHISSGNPVNDFCFSPDGASIAMATRSGVTIYQTSTGASTRTLVQDSTWSVAFSDDGSRVIGGSNGLVVVWDVSSSGVVHLLDAGATPVRSVTPTSDALGILGGGDDGLVRRWSLISGTLLLSWDTGDPVQAISANPLNTEIATAGGSDGLVNVWDSETGQILHPFGGHTSTSTGVRYSPDGNLIVSTSLDGTIRVWSFGNHWWKLP